MVVQCKYCNKEFASYSSRSNHVKKFHSEVVTLDVIKSNPPCNQNVIQIDDIKNEHKCKFCNKNFKYRQGKWKHEKICNEKKEKNEIYQIKKQNEKLEKQNDEMKQQLEELKDLIQKSMKIHP